VSAFRRALTWTKSSSGLMREGLSAPASLDGNIRKEVIRRRQERQPGCRIWLDEEGEVARESRAAIRKRIVTAHQAHLLGLCPSYRVQLVFQTESAQIMLHGKPQRPCLQCRRLRLLVSRDWKSLFDLQDFLWCVLSEQALHIGRKFPQQIANRIGAQGASKAV